MWARQPLPLCPHSLTTGSTPRPHKAAARFPVALAVRAPVRPKGSKPAAATKRRAGQPGLTSHMGTPVAPSTRSRPVPRTVTQAGRPNALPYGDVLATREDKPAIVLRKYIHLAISLGLFFLADIWLQVQVTAAGVQFPSALIGMFVLFFSLVTLDKALPKVAESLVQFFKPATTFIARWLPVFFVPSLVVLPLALQGLSSGQMISVLTITVVGMVVSCAFTAQTAVVIRSAVRTEVEPYEPTPSIPPFHQLHVVIWVAILIAGFALISLAPTAIMDSTAATASIFFLAATMLGYIIGTKATPVIRKFLHPILSCAIGGELAVLTVSTYTGQSFFETLALYKVTSGVSAGTALLFCLGSVILSFAFQMYSRRKLMMRHAPEIFGSVVLSALFSLFSTAVAGRLLGLPGDITRAMIPRSVTVALALPIAKTLDGANPSLTAAVVVVTGLIGANFVQAILNRLGHKDPITRGVATAGSCHGLGTAALAAKEPDALPFCAISYALIGIISSVLVTLAPVRNILLAIAG